MELELDTTPSNARPEAAIEPTDVIELELDLVDPAKGCSKCGAKVALDSTGVCRACHERTARARQSIPVIKDEPEAATLESALGAAASEGAATANAFGLGTVANGRASLGVGFSSAVGYIEALRRGVGRATFEEYVQILRTTYKLTVAAVIDGDHYTVKLGDSPAFTERLLAVAVNTGELSTEDSHANDAGIAKFKAESAARKAAAAKLAAELAAQTPLASAPVVEDRRITLRHGEMVAGAAAEGHGVLVGWTGKGPLTLEALTALATAAQVPADAMPKARDASAHARRAVQAFARGDVTLYTEDRGRKWRLERPVAGAQPGEKSGEVALVATLHGEATLECEGDPTLAIQVKAEFDRLVSGQIFDAGEVTTWIVTDVLRGVCNAVKYGGNYYVARRHRALAERLTTTLDGQWGRDWMNPALPIATTEQLAKGLARGLADEIEAIIDGVEQQRNDAKGKGKEDIGAGAAATAIGKLRKASERVIAYAALLGDALVDDCRNRIKHEMEALSLLTDDGIELRFAAVWDEIEFDIKNKGGVL